MGNIFPILTCAYVSTGLVKNHQQPLDPKTMKNEGFTPAKYGLEPQKMKVVGSHGSLLFEKPTNPQESFKEMAVQIPRQLQPLGFHRIWWKVWDDIETIVIGMYYTNIYHIYHMRKTDVYIHITLDKKQGI